MGEVGLFYGDCMALLWARQGSFMGDIGLFYGRCSAFLTYSSVVAGGGAGGADGAVCSKGAQVGGKAPAVRARARGEAGGAAAAGGGEGSVTNM